MRLVTFFLTAGMLVGSLAQAQSVPVTGAPGASLKSISGTATMVTVVLKKNGAKDPNLRVLEVRDRDFVVVTEKNDRYNYFYEDVKQVLVQDGKAEKSKLDLPKAAALRADDQKIVERVYVRTKEIFSGANDNQERKIHAAAVLAAHGDKDAMDYLKGLAGSNDMQVKLDATTMLYVAGDKIPMPLLRDGLESGNRNVRLKAAKLAGLADYRDGVPILNKFLQDRDAQYAGVAAVALARLGNTEIIPQLIGMLGERNEEKAAAAVRALTKLGGPEIVDQMKLRMKEVQGMERCRVAEVLNNLKDPAGEKELKTIFTDIPTLAPDVALILGKQGNFEATQYLRGRLARREDPTDSNLLYRARNATSLYKGGDPSALAVFQELLRIKNARVRSLVCGLFVEMGDRKLLVILQPTIENVDVDVALNACIAAGAIAMPDFRGRWLEVED